jgi:hypothetical protein
MPVPTIPSVAQHKGQDGRQYESLAHSGAVGNYLAVASSVLFGSTWDGQVQLMMHRPGHEDGDLVSSCAAHVGRFPFGGNVAIDITTVARQRAHACSFV